MCWWVPLRRLHFQSETCIPEILKVLHQKHPWRSLPLAAHCSSEENGPNAETQLYCTSCTFALKRIFFLSFASKRKQAKYFFLCLPSSTFNFLPLKTLFSGSLARNYRILWHFKFCCHMINSAIRLNKSCPCVLEWFICISVLLLTRGYSLWHLSLLFSTLKLDSRALVGLCPQPHTSLPLPLPLFFLVFTGTGFWQTLCRPACCLKRTHLLPQSCHCCCSDALRKNVSCWVGERIALVAGDTLSLTSLDGHEFSRDQKLQPPNLPLLRHA